MNTIFQTFECPVVEQPVRHRVLVDHVSEIGDDEVAIT